MSLDEARRQIADLDRQIIRLAAKRVQLGTEAGRRKEPGEPMVDLAQEKRVLERARSEAAQQDLDEGLAEEMITRLIVASVTAQESDRIATTARGEGHTAVVVGGAGRMGSWMTRFLADSGYSVHILDPKAPAEMQELARSQLHAAQLVVLATPPSETARIYQHWSDRPPTGLIVDIASIKTPLMEAMQQLQDAGARVASIHPMFGPDTVVLRGSDIVVCDVGDEAAADEITTLFSHTTANLHSIAIERHDEAMAEVLSLAHATAIAFAAALPAGTHPVHSTTFRKLEALAQDVVHESPDVYYEIQADNPHSTAAVQHLQDTIARFKRIVAKRNRAAFTDLMAEGRRRLENREERRQEVVQ